MHRSTTEPWRVTLVETGDDTMTGGRLKRVLPYVGDETFCLTYGDGVADVDIRALDRPPPRRGPAGDGHRRAAARPLRRAGDRRRPRCAASPRSRAATATWINGGFFVCEPAVGDAIAGDDTKWEEEPLRDLADRGELTVYHHRGFWQAMDTLRERSELEALWESGDAPWCSW